MSEPLPAQSDASAEAAPPGRFGRRWWRLDVMLFVLATATTLLGKTHFAWISGSDGWFTMLLPSLLPDVAFFAAAAVVLLLLARLLPDRLAARIVLLLVIVLGGWTTLNIAWLESTGVQIQPGVITAAMLDLHETHLIVIDSIQRRASQVVPALLIIVALAGYALFRLVRPARPLPVPRSLIVTCAVIATAATLGASRAPSASDDVAVWQESIGFSSHWHALATISGATFRSDDAPTAGRAIPHVSTQPITAPPDAAPRPNVVIVILESVNHRTSLGGDPATTPALRALARDGVEFRTTRAPLPHTTKAIWSILTGQDPEIRHGAVESVLVDEPYASLATALGSIGYRSAAFQMTRGAWEGGPGLYANLGMDHAWFREDLGDPAAHLGWTSGDDRRAIAPMFEWASAADAPFLLTLVTTISHDPWDLPAWWPETPADTDAERYVQSVACGDVVLAEIMTELERRGVAENTILCVLGDHGEVFRTDSRRGRWATFEDAIRVPWVMRWPAGLDAGTVVEAPCSQLDVTPTILALLGFDLTHARFDGRDALGAIPPDRRLFAQAWYDDAPFAMTVGTETKYMYFPATERVLRYDLATDPDERRPSAVAADDAASVIALLRAWQRRSWLAIPPERARSALLFDGWRTTSLGRATTAYRLDDSAEPAPPIDETP